MKIRQEIAYLGFSKRLTYFNLKFEEDIDFEKLSENGQILAKNRGSS